MNKCLQCGEPVTGRSDKKFCDAYCRNSYNNRVKREDEKKILHVNSTIRHNRRILKMLCPQGKAVVRKEVLDHMGYNFNYFSGIYRAPKGLLYFMCYDYGFAATGEKAIKKALIVQKQSYFDNYALDPWKWVKS